MINTKSTLAVVGVLLLAAVLLLMRSCDPSGAKSDPGAAPTATAAPELRQQSTAYIVKRIEPKLEKNSKLNLKLACPATTVLVAKTKFSCDVFDNPKGTGDPIAIVTVTIRDKTGYFNWESNPVG